MGSWDVTCMATNVGIGCGEDVVSVWLLEQTGEKGMVVYNNEWWAPLPYLTYGTYDDYGRLRDIHGHMLPKLIDYVKTHLFALEQGENEYHDIRVSAEDITAEFMFEANHEGRLLLHAPSWRKGFDGDNFVEKAHLRNVLLRRSFVDDLLANWTHKSYDLDTHGYIISTFDEACSELADEIPLWRKHVADHEGPLDLLLKDGEAIRWDDRKKFKWLSYIDWVFHNQWQYFPQNGKTHFMQSILDKTDEEFFYNCVEYMKFKWIKDFIGEARLMWAPVVGGPQFANDSYDANLFLANHVVTSVTAQMKQFEDEDREIEERIARAKPFVDKFMSDCIGDDRSTKMSLAYSWFSTKQPELDDTTPNDWLAAGKDEEPVWLACRRAIAGLNQ